MNGFDTVCSSGGTVPYLSPPLALTPLTWTSPATGTVFAITVTAYEWAGTSCGSGSPVENSSGQSSVFVVSTNPASGQTLASGETSPQLAAFEIN